MRRAALAVLVLATGALALTLAYRVEYTNWPWQGAPARLSWCGRHYLRGDGRAQPVRAVAGVPLHPVFRAPPLVGREVYSTFTAEGGAGRRCGTRVFLRTREGRAIAYGLSGGP